MRKLGHDILVGARIIILSFAGVHNRDLMVDIIINTTTIVCF